MSLTFASNFTEQNVLDTSQWRPAFGLHGGLAQELQAWSPRQANIVPGIGLRLQADKQSLLGRPFVSGEVTTRGLFAQTYGHFEMMAKMPQANGLWPAFWLLPEAGGWPPEIDVVEYIYAPNGQLPVANARSSTPWIGSNPAMTLHYGANNGTVSAAVNSNIKPTRTYQDWNAKPAPRGWGGNFKGYHIYAVDWRPGALVYQIDGETVFCVIDTAATGPRVPDGPMYMILDLAVSAGTRQVPGWPGYVAPDAVFPQAMDIAYVRAFQFKDLPAAAALPLDLSDLTLSRDRVSSGDVVTIKGKVRVGAHDLGETGEGFFTISRSSEETYDGIGADIVNIPFSLPALAAGRSYEVEAAYAVPEHLAAGAYSVGMRAAYGAGAGGGKATIAHRQMTLLSVTAADSTLGKKP